jgi:hypothetical protein
MSVLASAHAARAPLTLSELAAESRLEFLVLSMQAMDYLMGRFLATVVRVMAVTEHELTACSRMCADSPASRFVAVDFLYELVEPSADRTEDAELGNVRPESRPKPVIGAWLIDCARVHLEPVTQQARVENPEDGACRRGADEASHDDLTPLHLWSSPVTLSVRPQASCTPIISGSIQKAVPQLSVAD